MPIAKMSIAEKWIVILVFVRMTTKYAYRLEFKAESSLRRQSRPYETFRSKRSLLI